MDNNEYISKQKVEKWTTKEKFAALGDLHDIEPGTEYNLTGAIEEGELDSALQTKINGKLTAPTTPTADSAVTMLADGTVGTKPLSEIGKLYLHSMNITTSYGVVTVRCYSTDDTAITITNNNIPSGPFPGTMDGVHRGAVLVTIIKNDNLTYSASISGCISSASSETGMSFYNEFIGLTDSNFADTYIEL